MTKSLQLAEGEHLFTSESVTEGHPDKVADQISDAVVDLFLSRDPVARVACETMVTTQRIVLAGEDLEVLRSWLALHAVSSYAPYGPAALVEEDFAFSGRVLSGAEELRERWKRGVAFVEGTVGFAIVPGREDTFVDLAAIINAVVVFLITAAVVYFIFVMPMNTFQERRKRGKEPEPQAPAEDVLLLLTDDVDEAAAFFDAVAPG